jgi:hypothetical protein
LKVITKSEALDALEAVRYDDRVRFSIQSEPDYVGPVAVYFVQVWDGESVDYRDVLFVRRNGKVKVYECAD